MKVEYFDHSNSYCTRTVHIDPSKLDELITKYKKDNTLWVNNKQVGDITERDYWIKCTIFIRKEGISILLL